MYNTRATSFQSSLLRLSRAHSPKERQHRQPDADQDRPDVALPHEGVAVGRGRFRNRREAEEGRVRRHHRRGQQVTLAPGQLEDGQRLQSPGSGNPQKKKKAGRKKRKERKKEGKNKKEKKKPTKGYMLYKVVCCVVLC